MPFLGPLRVEFLPDGRKLLLDDLVYDGSRDRWTVPAGFVTDFASTPRVVWSVLPPDDIRYVRDAVLHDWHYVVGIVSRADADGVFRRCLRESGVSGFVRYSMWLAVRVFGGGPWDRARMRDGGLL